ncbi:MAG: hypothetical protein ABIJ27_04620 [Candidatus Omnitrophota bacterium]
MNNEEIVRRINEFSRWPYPFDLGGNSTPVPPREINRQKQRKRYFFDPCMKFLGGSLKGKTVLDIGCSAGYWSLCAS